MSKQKFNTISYILKEYNSIKETNDEQINTCCFMSLNLITLLYFKFLFTLLLVNDNND